MSRGGVKEKKKKEYSASQHKTQLCFAPAAQQRKLQCKQVVLRTFSSGAQNNKLAQMKAKLSLHG